VKKIPILKLYQIMELLKQNVGIDISKDFFDATFMILLTGQVLKTKQSRKFANTHTGIKEFTEWVNNLKDSRFEVHITMEATGVYYETLAYSIYNLKGIVTHVLLPNIVKRFFESLNIKTKTDKVDSKVIGQMGLERKLTPWVLHSKVYRQLRTLTREKEQLINERTSIKNQMHAEESSAQPFKKVITRYKRRIKYINSQIDAVERDVKQLVDTDDFILDKVNKLTTIPGVSFSTVVGIIAETAGFVNIKSIKQLTSYSGLDVVQKESGLWKGKTRISKKGNSHIRRLLYMPTLSVVRHSETFKKNYNRINDKKDFKMTGVVAMQRKVLGLLYTLWKNDTEYIENYKDMKVA